ncbi:TonB-dependent receptor [Rhabdobacter roseus]|uniref:TonB-linked SusC/RagA family outer membrane protein n=1 Tax=Rhabdobacter roseus TaxID=1655419 RepID=A0A840U0G3_9BACT|nr:TonB-dependent receptor [Rhabdobacter roseus]MBB5285630.1 TonB-linked SusC/RagA family outer membrane protein [Rhabdobacter roseus]
MKKTVQNQKKIAYLMRISLIQLCFAVIFVSVSLARDATAQELLNKKISLKANDKEIRTVLADIERLAGVKFTYRTKLLDADQRVTLLAASEPLSVVLEKVLTPLNIKYRVIGKEIVLSRLSASLTRPTFNPSFIYDALPADQTVSGTVTDENGDGLPGVSILVKGTTQGTTTDNEGRYSLSVPDARAILVFSFVGYESWEEVVGTRSQINVSLKADVKALSEIVVVGYGTQNRKDLTGSIASLSTQTIKDMPVTNIGEGMAGRMPGVLIQQASGAPGSGPSIKIRGLGSISAGNGPLIVVDGQPLNSGDLINGSGLNLINPNDIETVDVLKDASATAIFGSRGANGVVMITTKRGKAGKSTINFDYYTGIQEVSKTMNMLNAQQFAEFSKEATNNAYLERVPGSSASDPNSARPAGQRYRYPRGEFPWLNFDDPANLTSYNYQDLIFQRAPISNYQLSASGGSDKVQYMVSGNYLKQDGIIRESGINRYTFRSNLDAQLSPNIKVGMSISPSYTMDRRVRAAGHWADNGVINAALAQVPLIPIYQADGITYNSQASVAAPYDWAGVTNPVANITEADNFVNTLRLLGNTYVEIGIWKSLKYRGSVGGDLTFWRQNEFRASTMPLNQLLPPNISTGASATNQNINWVTNHTLDYAFELGTAHRFSALIGMEAQQNTLESNRVEANNFPNDIVRTINAGVISGGTSLKEEWSLASYFGRIGYTFNDRYLFNASIRTDGSSRFGANQRYGIFPSASVGWRVSEEAFLKNVAAISELKLKASVGLAGNNAFTNYGAIGTLGIDNYVIGNGLASGLATNVIGNPNLTWEKSLQTDIGMELGLLRNRIFVVADYYSRITSDLLLSVQVPSITGFTSANQNIGKVENKGMELGLTTRNTVGKFAWTTDLNISFNRNKVLALGPTGDAIRSGSGVGETNITVIGQPLGNFFGYQQIGVFRDQADLDASPRFADARPGDVKFADVNNDNVIDANDRTLIGNNQPDFIYGFNNTISFKGFDLSIAAQGVQGGQILNLSRRFIENLEGNQNQLSTVLDRWRSPDQPGNGVVPRANIRTTGNSNAISSRWIESASYFRIRNITLGYQVPRALSERIKIQNARVYAGVQNALTFTKYLGFNPEVSGYEGALTGGVDYGSYPLARTYTIGLNLSF